MDEPIVKPVRWIASSRDDLHEFPEPVRLRVGGALWEAQKGGKAQWAKPLKGYNGSGVVEIVDDHDGDTYRAVYTVRFEGVVFVLHAFQKKSKSGIATPKKMRCSWWCAAGSPWSFATGTCGWTRASS